MEGGFRKIRASSIAGLLFCTTLNFSLLIDCSIDDEDFDQSSLSNSLHCNRFCK